MSALTEEVPDRRSATWLRTTSGLSAAARFRYPTPAADSGRHLEQNVEVVSKAASAVTEEMYLAAVTSQVPTAYIRRRSYCTEQLEQNVEVVREAASAMTEEVPERRVRRHCCGPPPD